MATRMRIKSITALLIFFSTRTRTTTHFFAHAAVEFRVCQDVSGVRVRIQGTLDLTGFVATGAGSSATSRLVTNDLNLAMPPVSSFVRGVVPAGGNPVLVFDGLAAGNTVSSTIVTQSAANIDVSGALTGSAFQIARNINNVDPMNPGDQIALTTASGFGGGPISGELLLAGATFASLGLVDGTSTYSWSTSTTSESVSFITSQTNCLFTSESGGVVGDPHILRWNQKSFEFHGECDLLMVHSDSVKNGQSFDLHIRTTIDGVFSSITALALRIGDDTLEIDPHNVYYQGHHKGDWRKALLAVKGNHFAMTKPERDKAQLGTRHLRVLNITLSDESFLQVTRTFGYSTVDFLSVSITGGFDDFGSSYGLLGQYGTGAALSRDGQRNMEHQWIGYGMEWQVQGDEPKLFRRNRKPQLPEAKCKMPAQQGITNLEDLKRQHPELYDKASIACAHKGDEMADCIEDVMLAGDTHVAQAF